MVSISDDGSKTTLTSNGIPDHDSHSGSTPNDMQPVSTTVTFSSEPSVLSLSNVIGVTSQQLPMGPIGYAINGVAIYSWATSNCCDTGTEELDLIDNCNAHPSPNGQYHYHIYPRCISSCSQGNPSTILGVALDGFPIYGPVHPNGTILTNEYLDECHGIEVDVDGKKTYRYIINDQFPYTLGCYRGTVNLGRRASSQGTCTVDNLQQPCINTRKRRSSDLERKKRGIQMVCDGVVHNNAGKWDDWEKIGLPSRVPASSGENFKIFYVVGQTVFAVAFIITGTALKIQRKRLRASRQADNLQQF